MTVCQETSSVHFEKWKWEMGLNEAEPSLEQRAISLLAQWRPWGPSLSLLALFLSI